MDIRALLLLILVAGHISTIASESECESGNDKNRDKKQVLKYKLAAIASILVAGGIGACLPVVGKSVPVLRPDRWVFLIIKAFAAGVILATGFIHILPDAFENLTSPCLNDRPWGEFPFAGFVAMLASIATLIVDTSVTWYYEKAYFSSKVQGTVESMETAGENANDVHIHTHTSHGNSHSSSTSSELLRRRVISQVLEVGIVVNSVIIGISLGASVSTKTIKPLVAALSLHQFFEGVGLGGCITQAEFRGSSAAAMALFFSLTTPTGIAIGIGISSAYNENSPTALIVEGILNAASAGILIYMALVDLLAEEFLSPSNRKRRSWKLGTGAGVGLLFGAGCMSVLAKWA